MRNKLYYLAFLPTLYTGLSLAGIPDMTSVATPVQSQVHQGGSSTIVSNFTLPRIPSNALKLSDTNISGSGFNLCNADQTYCSRSPGATTWIQQLETKTGSLSAGPSYTLNQMNITGYRGSTNSTQAVMAYTDRVGANPEVYTEQNYHTDSAFVEAGIEYGDKNSQVPVTAVTITSAGDNPLSADCGTTADTCSINVGSSQFEVKGIQASKPKWYGIWSSDEDESFNDVKIVKSGMQAGIFTDNANAPISLWGSTVESQNVPYDISLIYTYTVGSNTHRWTIRFTGQMLVVANTCAASIMGDAIFSTKSSSGSASIPVGYTLSCDTPPLADKHPGVVTTNPDGLTRVFIRPAQKMDSDNSSDGFSVGQGSWVKFTTTGGSGQDVGQYTDGEYPWGDGLVDFNGGNTVNGNLLAQLHWTSVSPGTVTRPFVLVFEYY